MKIGGFVAASVMVHLAVLSMPFAGSTLHVARAAEQSIWDDSLADLSGVWASPAGEQIKLWFSREGSAASIPEGEVRVMPVTVDKGSGDVTYTVTPPDVQNLEARRRIDEARAQQGAAPREQYSTIRRNWDRDHKRFTIVMIAPNGANAELGFVRQLLPAERDQLVAVKGRVDAALKQQADLIAKEKQSKAAAGERQQSLLSSPEMKTAAGRLGMGTAFFSASPAQQKITIADQLRMTNEHIADREAELRRITTTKPKTDFDLEETQKRQKELETELRPLRQRKADLDLVTKALDAPN